MNAVFLAWLLTAMPPSGPATRDVEVSQPPRPLHEINRDLRDLIRRHARAEGQREAAETIRRMCGLYQQIRTDERLVTSPTLRSYRAKLWSKLKQIEADLERRLAQAERLGDPVRGGEPTEEERSSPGASLAREAGDGLAGTYSLVGASLGGPGQLLAHGGSFGGGAAPADLGPALVELIQRTIAPQFWDVHGGPGTIVYFAPLRVLVVRATSEIHHRIGGAVQGLRRAGQ